MNGDKCMKLQDVVILEADDKKKKKDKKDKTADKFPSFVAGNMLFQNVCSGKLSGTIDKK